DDVMSRAWVLRLLRKNLLQDRAGLELVLIGLVERVGGGEQGQRIEDPRLAVIGIALRNLLHLAHIGRSARAMVELVVIRVEGRERVEIILFAGGLRAQRQSPRDGVASLPDWPASAVPKSGSRCSWRCPNTPWRNPVWPR